MKKCINLPRYVVKTMTEENLNSEKLVWISIGEPEKDFEHVQNSFLDKLPKLKLSFHDITSLDLDIDYSDLVVPNRKIAHRIVRFILEHSTKNFIINCAAGVSRSGAICKFMEDHLEYRWPELTKKNALPNNLLYSLLVQAYSERKSKVCWPKKKINFSCPKCSEIYEKEIMDKLEIKCDTCSMMFSVNSWGNIRPCIYDENFTLCSDEIKNRGGPGQKPGQI